MEIVLNAHIENSANKLVPFHVTSIKEEGDDYIVTYKCNGFTFTTYLKYFKPNEQKLLMALIKNKTKRLVVKADVVEI